MRTAPPIYASSAAAIMLQQFAEAPVPDIRIQINNMKFNSLMVNQSPKPIFMLRFACNTAAA